MTTTLPPRVLLLVEDNPGDAELVREMLAEAERGAYQVVHVPRMSLAIEKLRSMAVDVVVIDLSLPDCTGVESVRTVRRTAGEIPIVVLTGTNDETMAMDCMNAGAQDYLAKQDARSQNLRRAIGYAITRIREAQVRELQETLERYRGLSSASQRTTVTAAIAGSGAIALRSPEAFQRIVRDYMQLLEPYLSRATDRVTAPRAALERIVTTIGDAGGGPRDILDVHVGALDRAIARQDDARSRSLVVEARLLALEMMGLLVDYYRVGQRRLSTEDARS